ncbi:MAG: hypothetical protein PWR22_2103 [Moorella sp. (in: firmicutes)]|jgi:hypothetical protein|uniref:hypothetical protein n=1 Tax=unclassified Neomoorella TaxID=2676739 RepID=UPI0010FFBA69|nr:MULTISPECIES: hypothetical protein [unclassified Moorella (in: firmicutes)]MDK2817474.1 hypothetical protein [Moorella sp. (in: firmicutes)]MDK2894043.1 hypothetical protein [Moorella sp. (in: firmicutes)]GEA14079.1 hypothetical protein E308F_03190 [Moorella sp. E308F]GEA18545.1 hypothetical protein E306M_16820 [Moorella sp. E306M]
MVDREAVRAAVKEAAADHGGKLPCAVAQEVARRLQVPMREVGQAADDLKIKIIQCQLGCFE